MTPALQGPVLQRLVLQGRGGAASSAAPGASVQDEDAAIEDEALLCVVCRHVITRATQRTEAFGGHVHDRVNPSGVAFRIGLFAGAEGARLVGVACDDFAWFPQHRWRIAVCGGCGVHVGWSFAGTSSAFYGLILEALTARRR